MMGESLIVSRAHEVVQMNPPDQHLLKCLKCGLIGAVNNLFGEKRCSPTLYRKSSGWRDEGEIKTKKGDP